MNNKKILSKGWKLLALNEICDLQNGYAFKSNDYINISNTLNCRMSNIRPDGFFDIEHNQKFLPDSYIEKYKQYLLKDGDVIIAMTDMATEAKILGVPTIVKTQGKNLLLNQRVGKLIIKKPELINFPYLKYVLNREQVKKYFLKFAGGGLQINLGKEDILSVEIPLPPIAEQKRIAEILDRTQSLISKRKEAIAKLDTLTQSIFLEMFGDSVANPKKWKVINMSECAERIQIGPFGTQLHEEDYIDNGIPLINPTHIKDGTIFPNSAFSISSEKHQELSQYHLEVDDVILGRRGEMGRCAIISENENGWLCGTGSLFIRPKHELLNSFYLFCVLSSQSIKKYLEKASQGVTMANLNKTIVSQIPMAIPPLPLQKEFAQRVEAVEKLKATHRASLSQLEALFASLQHRAFRGEL